MPSNFYRITVQGEWINNNGSAVACPNCRSTRGIAIEGIPGRSGKLRHCGRTFDLPRGCNAKQALLDAIAKAGHINYAR